MTEFHLDTFLTRIGMGNINAEWVDRFEASLIVSKCVDFDGMRVNWPRLDSVIKSLASLMFWLHLARCLFTRVVHSFVAVWAGRWSGWSAAGHTSSAARLSDWDGNRSSLNIFRLSSVGTRDSYKELVFQYGSMQSKFKLKKEIKYYTYSVPMQFLNV